MSEQHRYDSRDKLDSALTETIATQLVQGITSRGSARRNALHELSCNRLSQCRIELIAAVIAMLLRHASSGNPSRSAPLLWQDPTSLPGKEGQVRFDFDKRQSARRTNASFPQFLLCPQRGTDRLG